MSRYQAPARADARRPCFSAAKSPVSALSDRPAPLKQAADGYHSPENDGMVTSRCKISFMQPSSIVVRPALRSELDVLLQCDSYAQSNESRVEELRFALETQSCLVAEVASEAVGFVLLQYSFFGNGFIPLVCVPGHRRGHGFGLQLLVAAEQHCRTKKLFASTNSSNTVAQRLFTKAGFAPSGTIENLDVGDPELVYFKWVSR
ncbi:N-acetyltransferase family protein [Variovorax sp. LT1R16]|uniref:GNAT family N-acetyltransferase n=1 Tax=Variovorax sp. LT1R16 TaxID=3443728 RepID=UPI003F48CCFD